MSDITKCPGTGCPVKEKCLRFTVPSSEKRQVVFEKAPVDDKGNCDELIPNDRVQEADAD